MANTLNMGSASASNMTSNVSDITIAARNTDGVSGTTETEYSNPNFTKWYGYFCEIPDLKSAIIQKSVWIVGKGYTCEDVEASVQLDMINGNGKDSFEEILFNMDIMRRVNGDSYAEIIKDKKTGILLNLKPLDPASIKVIYDKSGRIKRYEQINKTSGDVAIKFDPKEIFHLQNNRVADNVHGLSDIEALEQTILADNESFVDLKKINHRSARPMIIFKLGTDNQTVINAFITKMDAAVNKGENIYIPDDANSVSFEVVQVNVSSMVMEWRNDLRKRFYRAIGLPELLPSGGGDSTESGGKIGFLAWQQIVEKEQRFLEQAIWNQLKIKINLLSPEKISQDLQQDMAKDGATQQMNFQPSDLEAGVGR